ncbi:hypothetical protein H4R27_005436, partial [Coemansia aciculifera]
MYVEERDIYTGAALRALSQPDCEGCVFLLVRTFKLVLESFPSDKSSELGGSEHSDESSGTGELNHSDQSNEPVNMDEVYQANVSAFISWIKQMIPIANDVYIEIDGYSDPDTTFAQHFSRLVTQLCGLGSRVKYNCKDDRDPPMASQLDEIRDLVHLSFEDDYRCNPSSYLARRNSQTLQSLCLKSRYLRDAVSLIRNPDGGY